MAREIGHAVWAILSHFSTHYAGTKAVSVSYKGKLQELVIV